MACERLGSEHELCLDFRLRRAEHKVGQLVLAQETLTQQRDEARQLHLAAHLENDRLVQTNLEQSKTLEAMCKVAQDSGAIADARGRQLLAYETGNTDVSDSAGLGTAQLLTELKLAQAHIKSLEEMVQNDDPLAIAWMKIEELQRRLHEAETSMSGSYSDAS